MAVAPASTDTEATGNVLVAVAQSRVAARFRVMSGARIDRVTWHVGDGSNVSVTGFIAIVRASDGVILAQNNAQALTPATITAGTGTTQTWNLTTAVTGLTAGDELAVVTWHSTGTIRYTARGGITGLTSVSALRTFASGTGELHRSGVVPAQASAPTSPVDLTATGAWVKRPLPIFVLSRTS